MLQQLHFSNLYGLVVVVEELVQCHVHAFDMGGSLLVLTLKRLEVGHNVRGAVQGFAVGVDHVQGWVNPLVEGAGSAVLDTFKAG
jgi:hypothetical protein